jgi:transcriptional regulator with XRE-family HTH domain
MTELEYYKSLGETIRQLRESKGVKQSELAEKMGIKSAILSEFENKGTKVSAYRIHQMMEILSGESFPQKKTLKLTLKSPDSPPTPLPISPAISLSEES